jgi:hypothetical protein
MNIFYLSDIALIYDSVMTHFEFSKKTPVIFLLGLDFELRGDPTKPFRVIPTFVMVHMIDEIGT